jgi:hypothetical protein
MKREGPMLWPSYWNREFRVDVNPDDQPFTGAAGTYLLPFKRKRLLRYLPSRAAVAEIGVARGKFSSWIKRVTDPRYLALIDPWVHQPESVYSGDSNNVEDGEQNRRHDTVRRRFASNRNYARVEVLRKFSHEAAQDFEDGFFDWIYIDANHGYDSVRQDLAAWEPKVRRDGFICGHDFAAHGSARKSQFGVVEAVTEFVENSDYRLVALTVEPFPSYVLARDFPDNDNLKRFTTLLLGNVRQLVAVEGISPRSLGQIKFANRLTNNATIVTLRDSARAS